MSCPGKANSCLRISVSDFGFPGCFPLGLLILACLTATGAEPTPEAKFHVPANPQYTIVDSVFDSLKFTLNRTLEADRRGHLQSRSSFVDPDGQVMGWHDFGNLEGPGWAANAVGGAWEIYCWGKFLNNREWQSNAVAILDHVLESGFFDEQNGFINGYRETTTGKFCLNYKHNSDWFCPGSMAKVAYQCLLFSDELKRDRRGKRLRNMAVRTAEWLQNHLEPVPNGWYPRRADASGRVYRKSPEGGDDRFWQTSADGLFIAQLQAALTQRGLADYRTPLRQKADVFVRAGGIFGSINHDTYDPLENVACSVAFRTLLLTSRVLKDKSLREFAFENCLRRLDQFKMSEDRNGVETCGLLYMEKSWDTAYLWENAEAALAWFEAAADIRRGDPARSREFELNGLTVLRAIARHHYGSYGFLTEGVDWNNHVTRRHHVGEALYGDINYTEPLLNHLHFIGPTLFYFEKAGMQPPMEIDDITALRIMQELSANR